MKLDLNLLPVFQALVEERRVGRAAVRLNLSQSAVSHALGRLRDALGDPLFVRTPGGLVPTARASALAPAVNEALARLAQALALEHYDPATSSHRFRLAMGGYLGRIFSPPLIAAALERSPGCAVEVWNKEADVLDVMDSGAIDLAVGNFSELPARFESVPIMREHAVWIARSGHPSAFAATTIEEVLALPRVEITSGAELNRSEAWLAGSPALRRAWLAAPRPVVEVNLSQSAIDIVSRTNLVTLAPRRIVAEMAREVDVRSIAFPQPAQFVEVRMAWARINDADPANRWLRELLLETAATLHDDTPFE